MLYGGCELWFLQKTQCVVGRGFSEFGIMAGNVNLAQITIGLNRIRDAGVFFIHEPVGPESSQTIPRRSPEL